MKSFLSKLLIGTIFGLNKIVLAVVLVLAAGALLLDLGLIGNGQSPLTTILVVYALAAGVLLVASLLAKVVSGKALGYLACNGPLSIVVWFIIGVWGFGWPDNFTDRHLGIYSLASGIIFGAIAYTLGKEPKAPTKVFSNADPNGLGAGVGVR